mmetsp:Transcript_19324/g.74095  ORF Transcript_19324/g.74095 Transcript_19324/m.74095 type:complete len:296 (-) Transcript_19324:152-1039(-)
MLRPPPRPSTAAPADPGRRGGSGLPSGRRGAAPGMGALGPWTRSTATPWRAPDPREAGRPPRLPELPPMPPAAFACPEPACRPPGGRGRTGLPGGLRAVRPSTTPRRSRFTAPLPTSTLLDPPLTSTSTRASDGSATSGKAVPSESVHAWGGRRRGAVSKTSAGAVVAKPAATLERAGLAARRDDAAADELASGRAKCRAGLTRPATGEVPLPPPPPPGVCAAPCDDRRRNSAAAEKSPPSSPAPPPSDASSGAAASSSLSSIEASAASAASSANAEANSASARRRCLEAPPRPR